MHTHALRKTPGDPEATPVRVSSSHQYRGTNTGNFHWIGWRIGSARDGLKKRSEMSPQEIRIGMEGWLV